jgi:hypothetical protein
VKFDVAVMTEESEVAHGSAGIKVILFNISGGLDASTANTAVGRVQFNLRQLAPNFFVSRNYPENPVFSGICLRRFPQRPYLPDEICDIYLEWSMFGWYWFRFPC